MSDRILDLVVLLPDLPSRLALMKSTDVSRRVLTISASAVVRLCL